MFVTETDICFSAIWAEQKLDISHKNYRSSGPVEGKEFHWSAVGFSGHGPPDQ